jgi:hypothetical protein
MVLHFSVSPQQIATNPVPRLSRCLPRPSPWWSAPWTRKWSLPLTYVATRDAFDGFFPCAPRTDVLSFFFLALSHHFADAGVAPRPLPVLSQRRGRDSREGSRETRASSSLSKWCARSVCARRGTLISLSRTRAAPSSGSSATKRCDPWSSWFFAVFWMRGREGGCTRGLARSRRSSPCACVCA